MPTDIDLTPYFRKDLKKLAKRYRSVRSDLQPLIERLQAGELPGDRVVGVETILFKVRLKNSNIQKDKSAGYRVIYYAKTQDRVVLMTIYSKSDQEDVSSNELKAVLAEYERCSTGAASPTLK